MRKRDRLFTLFFINWGQNGLMQKLHLLCYTIFTQFCFNSGELMRKSHRLCQRIFHQLGTKQTYRNLIEVLAQFFINWDQTNLQKSRPRLGTIFHQLGPNRLGDVSSTFSHNFSSIGTKLTHRNLVNAPAQFFIN
jgi:hypothetical protein